MMRKSFIYAGGLFFIVLLWLLSGQIGGDEGPDAEETASAGETSAPVMTVRARKVTRQPYVSELVVSGHTEAIRRVALRSQTEGEVEDVPVAKGRAVQKGDVICKLTDADRQANLDEARALEAQKDLEFKAARELASKGHRSETQVAAARAQLDAARAQVARAEVQLSYASIRAPFDGVVDDRPAEVGDYLRKGDICAHVIDPDPYLVIGEVSERNVSDLSVGVPGTARLVNGIEVSGQIRYLAEVATPETRTFRFELEVPNPDGKLRDGITAEIRLPLRQTEAFLLSRASLVLNDDGIVGARVVEDGVVRFYATDLLGDGEDGIWVNGLPENPTLITVGQDFVVDGQQVNVELEG